AGGVIALHEPPTAQNYAIGCTAKSITGRPYSSIDFPLGYVEGTNQPGLYPESLYLAQLSDRKGVSSSIPVAYKPLNDGLNFYQKGNSIFLTGVVMPGGGENIVQIYDMSGRMMYSQKVYHLDQGYALNTALSSGVYLLTLSGSEVRYAQKIIVK